MTTATATDTAALCARFDLRTLAAPLTTLRRESSTELAGPCPLCGGRDRFHVASTFFFCRSCYPLENGQPHDAIALMRWLHRCSFREAVEMLDGSALQPAKNAPPPATDDGPRQTRPEPDWILRQTAAMASYQEALWADENPVRSYLLDRALTPDTCIMYGLGYNADAHRRGPALAIPWYRAGELFAIHYRFLDGGDPRLMFASGSHARGLLWGKHAFRPDGRTLVIVEGEINAMSIRQVAKNARVDVLSLGGESNAITPAAAAFARSYPACIVWLDREDKAREKAAQCGGAALWSVSVEHEGRAIKCDANELLQRCALIDVLERALRSAGTPLEDIAKLGG